MSDKGTLQKLAREAMRAGKLPNRRPTRRWGGPGIGAACTICGKTIDSDEVEIQLEFAGNGDSVGDNHLHPACVAAWELECQRHGVGSANTGTSKVELGALAGQTAPSDGSGTFSADELPAPHCDGNMAG